MLATLVDQPFDSKDWLYETKWDGFRLVAEVGRGSVRLFSRNGIEVTARYPTIAQALRTITEPCVIDGELVALDAKGRVRFQLLQNALRDESTKLRYCVFDLLFLDGKDMRRKPLLERKALLKQALPRNSLLRYSKHIKAKGIALFKKAKQAGLEGVMAKRAAGLYYSGKRTREWLKFKSMNEQGGSSSWDILLRGARANTSAPLCSRCAQVQTGGMSGMRERALTKRCCDRCTKRCSL